MFFWCTTNQILFDFLHHPSQYMNIRITLLSVASFSWEGTIFYVGTSHPSMYMTISTNINSIGICQLIGSLLCRYTLLSLCPIPPDNYLMYQPFLVGPIFLVVAPYWFVPVNFPFPLVHFTYPAPMGFKFHNSQFNPLTFSCR